MSKNDSDTSREARLDSDLRKIGAVLCKHDGGDVRKPGGLWFIGWPADATRIPDLTLDEVEAFVQKEVHGGRLM